MDQFHEFAFKHVDRPEWRLRSGRHLSALFCTPTQAISIPSALGTIDSRISTAVPRMGLGFPLPLVRTGVHGP